MAIAYLAETEDLLSVFCAATGLSPDNLRARLDDPELHAAALDFLLQDDDWTIDFARFADISPDRIAAARRALPGGAAPDWT